MIGEGVKITMLRNVTPAGGTSGSSAGLRGGQSGSGGRPAFPTAERATANWVRSVQRLPMFPLFVVHICRRRWAKGTLITRSMIYARMAIEAPEWHNKTPEQKALWFGVFRKWESPSIKRISPYKGTNKRFRSGIQRRCVPEEMLPRRKIFCLLRCTNFMAKQFVDLPEHKNPVAPSRELIGQRVQEAYWEDISDEDIAQVHCALLRIIAYYFTIVQALLKTFFDKGQFVQEANEESDSSQQGVLCSFWATTYM